LFGYSNVIRISEQESSNITILPNPTKDVLNIVVASNKFNNTKAELINAQGKAVKSFTLNFGLQRFEISDLPNGLYYLVTNGYSVKVVITNK